MIVIKSTAKLYKVQKVFLLTSLLETVFLQKYTPFSTPTVTIKRAVCRCLNFLNEIYWYAAGICEWYVLWRPWCTFLFTARSFCCLIFEICCTQPEG